MMDGALGSGAEAAMASQDDAFSRAMTAMYWSGYWTAVFHVCVRSALLPGQLITNPLDLSQCRRNESQAGADDETFTAGAEGEELDEGEAEDEDMLPVQR